MKIAWFPLVLALAAVLAGCTPKPPADAPQGWRPGAAAGYDLLLVTLDTTRADHLGAYGYPAAETPTSTAWPAKACASPTP